jgi:hypothetical protein
LNEIGPPVNSDVGLLYWFWRLDESGVMAMSKCFAAAFCLVSAFSAHGQNRVVQPSTTAADVRLDPTKPTTYLAFERYDGDLVWLRLLNNSRWAVAIFTEEPFSVAPAKWGGQRDALGLLDNAVVSPAYHIERYPYEESVDHNGCTFSESWIPSGRSIVFNAPRLPLTYPATLRVSFRYEWELDYAPEPGHYVWFSGHQLPRDQ